MSNGTGGYGTLVRMVFEVQVRSSTRIMLHSKARVALSGNKTARLPVSLLTLYHMVSKGTLSVVRDRR
jgi:hypothetical protein